MAKRTRKYTAKDYTEARAILAVAAITKVGKAPHHECPNYYAIAKQLGLSDKPADLADELFFNANNGQDYDWSPVHEHMAIGAAQDWLEAWEVE